MALPKCIERFMYCAVFLSALMPHGASASMTATGGGSAFSLPRIGGVTFSFGPPVTFQALPPYRDPITQEIGHDHLVGAALTAGLGAGMAVYVDYGSAFTSSVTGNADHTVSAGLKYTF